jgi:hypothetical protein
MKTFLLSALLATAAFGQSPLSGTKTVFLLPMPGGLDQYLAVRLSEESNFTVVTKVENADLVFTDQLSPNLEKSLAQVAQTNDQSTTSFARPGVRSSFTRSKGTVFLVDRQSGNVVWSTIEEPRSTTLKDLRTAADRIVDRLNKARAGKQ